MNDILFTLLVFALASWAAMACAGCGCGGCVEPTGGTPNSSHCTPDATAGYTFCIWPAVSGQGCAPGGSCQRFANQKFCLKWVSDPLWQTTRFTVDCTTTYGVSVDIQWQMTIDGSGNVVLSALAYVAGTNTVVATLVTYSGAISLSKCNQPFSVCLSFDGGQCQSWPGQISVAPTCCADCLPASGCVNFYVSHSCPCQLPPATLFATFSTPGCPALDGLVVPLPFSNISCVWEGIVTGVSVRTKAIGNECQDGYWACGTADVHIFLRSQSSSFSNTHLISINLVNLTGCTGGTPPAGAFVSIGRSQSSPQACFEFPPDPGSVICPPGLNLNFTQLDDFGCFGPGGRGNSCFASIDIDFCAAFGFDWEVVVSE